MSHSVDGTTTSPRTMWVETIRRQLTGGQPMRIPCTPFAVRRPRRELGHNAGTYVKCELGDQTGWIEAVWWDAGKAGQIELERLLAAPVWAVEGTASLNRYGGRENPQVRLESVRAMVDADALTLPGLLRRSHSSEAELGEWLSGCIAEFHNLPLRRLLGDCLSEGGSWRTLYLRAPAGLFYHHAYVGGLVDHVREMASTWLAALDSFPRVDRDLTMAGILLHDVGKLDTFAPGHVPQMARAGRYMDHITAGIARLTRAVDAQHGFPPLLREQLLHIVISHHGEKEHGSPVIPATREAIVVHQLDRLSSLLSHFEEWANQSVTDHHGWSTEPSPWLRVPLATTTEVPDGFAEADSVR